jgi:hypothetical protein
MKILVFIILLFGCTKSNDEVWYTVFPDAGVINTLWVIDDTLYWSGPDDTIYYIYANNKLIDSTYSFYYKLP